jgi:hypothetical protein
MLPEDVCEPNIMVRMKAAFFCVLTIICNFRRSRVNLVLVGNLQVLCKTIEIWTTVPK